MEPILQAKKIQKTFFYPKRVEVLKSISLDLYPGECIAIMGASGEGKSTLLHILGTLEAPSSGELFIAGKSVTHSPPAELRNLLIGFVFQSFNLLEDHTLLENVLMPAVIGRNAIHKGSAAYERACLLIEKVGLSDRIDFSTKHLSGGEKQRAALARAFLNEPQIILADEPTGNLDHVTSLSIHDLLIRFVKENNKSLIVVTHDQELASLCDKTLHLSDGYLISSS